MDNQKLEPAFASMSYDDYDNPYSVKEKSDSHRRNGEKLEANQLFGGLVTLPDNVAPLANFATDVLKPAIIRRTDALMKEELPKALQALGMEDKLAGRTGKGAAGVVAYGIVFSKELASAYSHVRGYIQGRKALMEDLAPVLKAHGHAVGIASVLGSELAHNEVVQVARGRLKKSLMEKSYANLSGLIADAPVLYGRWKEQELQQTKTDGAEGRVKSTNPTDAFTHRVQYFEEQGWSRRDAIAAAGHVAHTGAGNDRRIKEEIAETQEMLRTYGVLLGAIGAGIARGYFIGKEEKTTNKNTALEMICQLSDTAIDDPKATGVKGVPFAAYIRKIFDTHQENMGQSHIGKRFDEKLDYACKEIAKAITEGQMHPMALVDLVGERKIVQDKGKRIASREQVAVALEEAIKRMPAKFAVDADEYMAEATVTEEDMKHALGALEEKDRAFYISLMPEEVARKIGVKEAEIKAAHDRAGQDFAERLLQVALDLGTLSDEKLKEKLSDKEIALIRKVAPIAQAGEVREVLQHISTKGEFAGRLDTLEVNALGAGLVNHPGALYEEAGHRLFEKGAGEASRPQYDDRLVETERTGEESASKSARKKARGALSGKFHDDVLERGEHERLDEPGEELTLAAERNLKTPTPHIRQAAYAGHAEKRENHNRHPL